MGNTSAFLSIKVIFGFDNEFDCFQGWETNQKSSIMGEENLIMDGILEEICSTSFRMFVIMVTYFREDGIGCIKLL